MNTYGVYTCYKKCGSRKVVGLSRMERNILNSLTFKCQHADEHGCEAIVKYEDYKKHLKEDCVHKLVFPEEAKPAVQAKPVIEQCEEEEDVDMGGLFGDDDDY